MSKLTLAERKRLEALYQRLKVTEKSKVDFLQDTFKEQRQFITDSSKMKGLICTRRAAKSYTMGLHLFKDCYENPGVSCLYIALTRQSAKRILWKDVVKPIINKYNIDAEPKESELSVHFGNGSILYLVGADSGPDEMNKLLGQKFKTIMIDEGSMWRQDLSDLVYTILKPAVADYRGTIGIGGTPSNFVKGLFYDLTFDSRSVNRMGWNIHSWDTYANPYMCKQWDDEIKELLVARPGIEDTPRFQQMYKKQWVIDTESRVYKLSYDHVIDEVPCTIDNYILGIDFGYEDDTAFVLGGWNKHQNVCYIIESYSKQHMLLDDVGIKIQEYMNRYQIDKVVVDGAGKQFVKSLAERFQLHLENTDKRDKYEYIQLFNTDLLCGRLKVLERDNKKLIDEMMNLIWDIKADGKRKELASLPNHLNDAALYLHRYCYHYFSHPVTKKKKMTDEQQLDAWEQKEIEKLEQKVSCYDQMYSDYDLN